MTFIRHGPKKHIISVSTNSSCPNEYEYNNTSKIVRIRNNDYFNNNIMNPNIKYKMSNTITWDDSCMIGYVGELPVKYDFNSKSMKFINPNRIGHPLENSTNRLTIENNLFMFVRRNFNLSLEGATYLVSIFTRRTAVNYIIDMLDDLIYYESEKISPLYVILKRYYDNMKYFLNNIKIKEISV